MNDPLFDEYHLYIVKMSPRLWFWRVDMVYKGETRFATGTCPTKGACYDAAASYRQYVLKG